MPPGDLFSPSAELHAPEVFAQALNTTLSLTPRFWLLVSERFTQKAWRQGKTQHGILTNCKHQAIYKLRTWNVSVGKGDQERQTCYVLNAGLLRPGHCYWQGSSSESARYALHLLMHPQHAKYNDTCVLGIVVNAERGSSCAFHLTVECGQDTQ